MNSHPLLDIPKPTSIKIKLIGGIGIKKIKENKPLEPEFERILKNAKKGTVLFSFGTFMRTKLIAKGMFVQSTYSAFSAH